jgi:GNAT superfamily N-acetyltransferase
MINHLACRRAVPEDVSAIEALAARSIRALHAGAYDDAVIREAIDHAYGVDWQLVRDGTYFVATAAGTIVGAGGWGYRRTIAGAHGPNDPAAPRLSPPNDAARIRAFYVDPGYVRQGIGTLLLTASERGALNDGFTRAELTATIPAVPFYAAHGYEPVVGYDLPLPSGRILELRLMTKRLISNP